MKKIGLISRGPGGYLAATSLRSLTVWSLSVFVCAVAGVDAAFSVSSVMAACSSGP